jgi:hypothetical protein
MAPAHRPAIALPRRDQRRRGPASKPGRACALATALAGGLAGLAAAAAFVAAAPVIGRVEAVSDATRPAMTSESSARAGAPRAPSVATVLAPAIEAGLPPASGRSPEDGPP